MYKVLCFFCFLWVFTYSATASAPLPGTADLDTDTSEIEGRLTADASFWIGLPDQTSSLQLLVISAGKKVTVKSEYKKYYKVLHRNLIGYVEKDLIEIISPPPSRELHAVPAKKEVQPASSSPIARKGDSADFRLTKETSLRNGPDSKERVILRFQVGDEVEVLDDSGYWWWQVRFQGKTGWVKKALLEKS